MPEGLKYTKRCPADVEGGQCDSAVFYDWGLIILNTSDVTSVQDGAIDRWKGYATPVAVKICARCMTPYIIEGGELVDISDELGAEDIRAILARGQAMLPHVKIKDP